MTGFIRLLLIVSLFAALSAAASGQDLGSSNKLFPKKGKAPAKTEKKTAAKPKAAPKKKPVASKPKPTRTSKAKASSSKTASKPAAKKNEDPKDDGGRFSEFKDPQTPKSVVTIERSKPLLVGDKNDYEDLIERGNEDRDQRDYASAESAYKKARGIDPKDSRATYGLGNLYSDQQRWEEAERAYRSALQLEPRNAIVHIALSYVLTQPIAVPDLPDRYEEAEKVARKAIQLAPQNALAFDQLGAALELRGLIGPDTENAYRKAIELDPSFAPAYAHLGRLLRRRGQSREAVLAYENAIQRANDPSTLTLIGEILQSEQRYAESEPLLQKALTSDPRNPSTLLLLGRAQSAQAKFAEAERTLRTNLSVSPSSFDAHSMLASIYLRQSKFAQAETALLDAQRNAASYEKRGLAIQFESLGDSLMRSGDKRAAERSYRQAISLDAENQGLVSKLSQAKKG